MFLTADKGRIAIDDVVDVAVEIEVGAHTVRVEVEGTEIEIVVSETESERELTRHPFSARALVADAARRRTR